MLEALANPYRLKIIGLLQDRRIHVSLLAREMQISRPLLYLHLKRLENAGLVEGHIELSDTGKAMKYYEVIPFHLSLDQQSVAKAAATVTVKKAGRTPLTESDGKDDD